ncbi:MAG: replication protein [Gammaproteobacteria bacterium]|nr:replication protein [Gammaproteobacteria bacterium]
MENGYTRLANELLEALLAADLSKREWLVVMTIARKTYGFGKGFDRVGDTQIAQMTGVHRVDVSKAKTRLLEAKILRTSGREIGINPVFGEWVTVGKTPTPTVGDSPTQTANETSNSGTQNVGDSPTNNEIQNTYSVGVSPTPTVGDSPTHKRKKESKKGSSLRSDPKSPSLRSVEVGDRDEKQPASQDEAAPHCKTISTPYDEMLKIYREILVPAGMPDLHGMSEPRKLQAKAFWTKRQAERRKANRPEFTLSNWRSYCQAIATTHELRWLVEPYKSANGNQRRSNLETILRESILDKVRDALHAQSHGGDQ